MRAASITLESRGRQGSAAAAAEPEPSPMPVVVLPAEAAPPVSVIILTYNEEHNIARAIRSCAWCDDVHVVDSGSEDRTREIAESLGAKVHVHAFESFGRQRNWAIDNIACKHPWHFHLDADERFTSPLVSEMLRELGEDGRKSDKVAYMVPNQMIFMDRWLRYSGGYPSYQVRLFRFGRCRFVDFGHGQREQAFGPIGRLRSSYVHFNFSKGMIEWLQKHDAYSSREAAEGILVRQTRPPIWGQLTSPDALNRRRALKNLSFFLHGRAVLRFLDSFIRRGGWRDGTAGFHYCVMIAMYEYWIELKIVEKEAAWRRATDSLARGLLGPETATASANGHGNAGSAETAAAPLVEILIPTLNEADHIAQAVRNARKLGPVFVLDSFSTDGTQQLARAAGATVVEHAFENYSSQKNWGLTNLPFRGEWIFILDADERVTPELRDEIQRVLSSNPKANGFFINRVLLFMGRQVRHGGLYPSWNLRLFRRGYAAYEDRSVHEHMMCKGTTDYMRNEMLHIRRESITQFMHKHIVYADMESDEWVKWKIGRSQVAAASALFRDVLRYRLWIRREIWPRTPLRPLWRFLYMYVFRFGFLDGRSGWHLARLMMCYEYMISLLYFDKLLREERKLQYGAQPLPARNRSTRGIASLIFPGDGSADEELSSGIGSDDIDQFPGDLRRAGLPGVAAGQTPPRAIGAENGSGAEVMAR